MNAPAAGWNPDPTGRHEYRYWDGATWTDDVSDNGVTAVDPVDATPSFGGDPTAVVDTTQRYGTPSGPQPGPYQPQPGAYDPMYSSGQVAPAQPPRSGPPTGLIVGLAAVALALIVGLVVVLTGGDDDDTATDDPSSTTEATTEAPTDDPPDTTEATTSVPGGDEGIVDLIATGMELEADGLITREQAECAAQAMVDHFGVDALLEMSTTGDNPWDDASTEDQTALVNLMTACIPADVLVDIGMSQAGG